ncbi:enoyl-CoA hydratase/isomerase family protein [Actinomadura rudentiformis]|uniref:Enoyl-CoA hydratase/isomerase family protein n=1 Tax=Actinomadura rudentiformis TaxID=359158 RepID=A0A6H9Y934_9ACTN|nr:enoyl-CoA hydratase/isomerase family protein [Actinomadura rudentiformis]KAB2341534.1 enoyl-CoA hydratase/isomerase family protein [Actinomadura rudentiformis]
MIARLVDLLHEVELPLRLTTDGVPAEPLKVVDLQDAGSEVDEAQLAAHLGLRPQVIVGVLPDDPSPNALRLARACTVALTRSPLDAAQAVTVRDLDDAVATLSSQVSAAPVAAISLHQLLCVQEHLPVAQALMAESAMYSTLLAGAEFARWRAARPVRRAPETAEVVSVHREEDLLQIVLQRPARRNAYNRMMRDGLVDALTTATVDASLDVMLTGAGPDFCAGGDLDEFGSATDVSVAHLLRTGRSAGWLLHRLRERTAVRLHGHCIGAGIELPAFAGRVIAEACTAIRLPEVAMGLVPGAGGTVSIVRRIGRWRTAWLALSGQVVSAGLALDWGLVDEVEE